MSYTGRLQGCDWTRLCCHLSDTGHVVWDNEVSSSGFDTTSVHCAISERGLFSALPMGCIYLVSALTYNNRVSMPCAVMYTHMLKLFPTSCTYIRIICAYYNTYIYSTSVYMLLCDFVLQMLVLRTMTTVLELLAALCLVKGGHEKIMAGVDTFKVVRLRH